MISNEAIENAHFQVDLPINYLPLKVGLGLLVALVLMVVLLVLKHRKKK